MRAAAPTSRGAAFFPPSWDDNFGVLRIIAHRRRGYIRFDDLFLSADLSDLWAVFTMELRFFCLPPP